MTARLELIAFPGAYNLVTHAGREKGFYAAQGLDVRRSQTPTSMYQIQHLLAGDYHIAVTSFDNVVAYQEGQGEVDLDLLLTKGRDPDLFVFLGLEPSIKLPLMVAPEIGKIDDLRGKSLAVDAVATGFSFVLREILATGGLAGDDYQLVSVGAADKRLMALKQGQHMGAILTPPFNHLARAAGFIELATSLDAFKDYQGTCYVTTRAWAGANRDRLTGFIRATVQAMGWIGNPDNREEAAVLLAHHTPNMSPQGAARAVTDLARQGSGISPSLNIAGARQVLALRSRYGVPRKTLDAPQKYVDMGFYDAALKSRG